MADPRDPGKSAGDDFKDAADDPTRTPVRSERIGADTREGESSTFGAEGEQRKGGGGGLANLAGGRLVPIVLAVVVLVVLLVILAAIL